MAGGLSVIGDVYKTDVYRLASFINREVTPCSWVICPPPYRHREKKKKRKKKKKKTKKNKKKKKKNRLLRRYWWCEA